jgi:hypothetical protein
LAIATAGLEKDAIFSPNSSAESINYLLLLINKYKILKYKYKI